MSDAGAVAEPVERKPWSSGMAPAYIGTFLWVAFFDGLGRRALPLGGLAPTLMGVIAAAVLAYLLLYRVPATWGFAARRPLDELAAATFGTSGGRLVPNLVVAVGQVMLFAIGIGYATDLVLRGLLTLGLFEPRVLRPVAWGGRLVPSPLFLTVALVWGVVTALAGMTIVRWIAAIMQYFPVFSAAGLALAMAATFTGLGHFRPSGIDPTTGLLVPFEIGARLAFLVAFQWTFGLAALLGITGADWGAASPSLADVRQGGWFSLAFAPVVVASLALLAVAGHEGKLLERAEAALATGPTARTSPPAQIAATVPATDPDWLIAPERYTFRAAVGGGLNRPLAAGVFIIFGLASLAPACFAAHEFGRRGARFAPGLSRLGWTLVGVTAGWFLIVGGWFERTDILFSVLGALFAPIAGAMVADSTRHRQAGWPDPRRGINFAGLMAWAAGAAVGLAPTLARSAGLEGIAKVPAATLLAFAAGFLVYAIAAALGLEPPATTPDKSVAPTD